MFHIVTESCIKCKFTNCVNVCPVSAFREGNEILVIDNEVCIDCGMCIPECPTEAIEEEYDKENFWYQFNEAYAKKWPVILSQKNPLPDSEKHLNENDKYSKYFLQETKTKLKQ